MAQSASNEGVVDMSRLDSHVRNIGTAEELTGALESLLCSSLQTSQAAKYTELLVRGGCFDSSKALAELELKDLVELGVPVGHRNVVLRAVFNGLLPSAPATPMQPADPLPLIHPIPAVGNPIAPRDFKREWPDVTGSEGLPSAVDLTQFALFTRGHLREMNDVSTATEMWRRVEDPSARIVEDWAHAGPMDARFARILQGAGKHGMPAGSRHECVARALCPCLRAHRGLECTAQG
jgi:hypothetical protein